MRWIQVALLLGSVLLLVLYSLYLRSSLRDRILVVVLFLAGLVAILAPGVTTTVANALGVGRGADLVMYLFILAVIFGFIVVNARIMRLEDHITVLVRELALLRARRPAPDGEEEGAGAEDFSD